MKEMFKGKVNSPITYLKEAVTQEGNILYLASNSILPDELPNLLVIGEDENAETVKVLNTRADGGLDVERGFQGISKAWPKTTQVARNITEYDIRALQDNVKELNENKVEKVEGKKLSSEDYTAEEKEEVKKIKEKIDIAKLNNNFEDILEIVDEETLKSFVPTINVIKTLFENIPQPVLASLTEDGLLSKELFSVINKIPEDAKYTDTVYSLATALKDGLMSKEDKSKLDGLQKPEWVSIAGKDTSAVPTGCFYFAIALSPTSSLKSVTILGIGQFGGIEIYHNNSNSIIFSYDANGSTGVTVNYGYYLKI